ncbi:MAG TPA: hypothetical protein ENF80_04970 [Thermofilum sp.]|nr:hypothetical protein [Thermofilum sp.]
MTHEVHLIGKISVNLKVRDHDMKCMHVDCDLEAEYIIMLDNRQVYLCKKHFSKITSALQRKALKEGSASLDDIHSKADELGLRISLRRTRQI